jgi:hypothetical protein
MSARRRAVTLLEVLIALVVLMLASITIIGSGGSIHTRSYLNEFHALAAIRARTLLSFATALDFDTLRKTVGTAGGTSVTLPLEQFFEPDELDTVFRAPSVRNALYMEKLKDFKHEVRGRMASADLLELEVIVRWVLPAEKREAPHEYRLFGAIHRPAAGFSLRPR